jgi:hypothetical protein
MGWVIQIEADREIDRNSMSAAIELLPVKFLGEFKSLAPQEWGWPLEIHVRNPEGKTLTLEGSYCGSAGMATEFADALVLAMCKHGLRSEIVFNDLNH